MPVNPYRRHIKACPFREQKSRYNKCQCPIWADGKPLTSPRNLNTREWTVAQSLVRDIEISGGARSSGRAAAVANEMTLAEASAAFFADPDSAKRGPETTRKHKTLHKQLAAFAARRRVEYLADVTPDFIASFRTWYANEREDTRGGRDGRIIKDSALAANKKFERLRQFFHLALRREWIVKDPTAGVKLAPVKIIKKRGFEPREMMKILHQAALDVKTARSDAKANCLRLQAMVLFLRYSGLRISDVVGCQIDWVKKGRVQLTCRKNQTEIDVELPEHVIDALGKIPTESDLYFFWRGTHDLRHRVKDWEAHLSGLFKRAGISGGHAHRFRHTFAISLLEQPGKTLQDVADALGDTLAVVQRHYSGKSEAKQKRIDNAIRDTWRNDPVLAMLDVDESSRSKVN